MTLTEIAAPANFISQCDSSANDKRAWDQAITSLYEPVRREARRTRRRRHLSAWLDANWLEFGLVVSFASIVVVAVIQ